MDLFNNVYISFFGGNFNKVDMFKLWKKYSHCFTSGGPEVSPPPGLCPAELGPVFAGTEPAALSAPPRLIVLTWPAVPSGLHARAAVVSPSGRPTPPAASLEPCRKRKKKHSRLLSSTQKRVFSFMRAEKCWMWACECRCCTIVCGLTCVCCPWTPYPVYAAARYSLASFGFGLAPASASSPRWWHTHILNQAKVTKKKCERKEAYRRHRHTLPTRWCGPVKLYSL